MNTPKISLKIIRHEYVKNLLGDSYDDIHNPFPEIVNVGTYTLAHVEGMQEFLKQEEDVTSYNNNMSDLDMELPDFMFNTGVKFDL
jgi:hypothetical protein